MTKLVFIVIIVLVAVLAITVFGYLHKRHHEYKMADIEKAVRSAFVGDAVSVEKACLVRAVKRHFHCSSKEAHYIIGVARRKKLVDIAADAVRLLPNSGTC